MNHFHDGQHLKADLLQFYRVAEGTPCPICQATLLKMVEDMFFKPKVRQLKVWCSPITSYLSAKLVDALEHSELATATSTL